MVYIPAGSFLMGDCGVGDDAKHEEFDRLNNSSERPQHSVRLSGYWIGTYEITRGEYGQFMKAGGYSKRAYWSANGWSWKTANRRTEPDYWDARQNWGDSPEHFMQTDSHPAAGVTYYEAEAFCKWARARLPTEAQWEKAARRVASSRHPNIYPWGDVWDAQRCKNGRDSVHPGCQSAPVGSYPSGASPSGCQDMAGNVREWCRDWYADDYYRQTPRAGWADPQGPSKSRFGYRVLRGGSWASTRDGCRCAERGCDSPDALGYYYGFRVVR